MPSYQSAIVSASWVSSGWSTSTSSPSHVTEMTPFSPLRLLSSAFASGRLMPVTYTRAFAMSLP